MRAEEHSGTALSFLELITVTLVTSASFYDITVCRGSVSGYVAMAICGRPVCSTNSTVPQSLQSIPEHSTWLQVKTSDKLESEQFVQGWFAFQSSASPTPTSSLCQGAQPSPAQPVGSARSCSEIFAQRQAVSVPTWATPYFRC